MILFVVQTSAALHSRTSAVGGRNGGDVAYQIIGSFPLFQMMIDWFIFGEKSHATFHCSCKRECCLKRPKMTLMVEMITFAPLRQDVSLMKGQLWKTKALWLVPDSNPSLRFPSYWPCAGQGRAGGSSERFAHEDLSQGPPLSWALLTGANS